jgi:hypothetical protein
VESSNTATVLPPVVVIARDCSETLATVPRRCCGRPRATVVGRAVPLTLGGIAAAEGVGGEIGADVETLADDMTETIFASRKSPLDSPAS